MTEEEIKLFLVQKDISIKQAMTSLTERGIKILFIIDENQNLIGTLTDGDIRRGITSGIELTAKVKEIMQRDFFSISVAEAGIKERAGYLMKKHRIEYVPILDITGKVIDIISWHDIIVSEHPGKKWNLFDTSVVIMAGGRGTRLDPFTKILPKPLIPLGDKPIVEIIMDSFYERGFYKFKVVVNHKKEMIKLYFSENKQPYEVELIEEEEYYGTIGGLWLLKEKIKGTFILTNCDTLLEGDYGEFLAWHKEHSNTMTIIGSHKEVVMPYGILNMNNGRLVEMIEKPRYDFFVNTGSYVMEPDIYKYMSDKERLDIDQLIMKMQASTADKIGVFPCWDRWFDIGQWDEYRRTLKKLGIES